MCISSWKRFSNFGRDPNGAVGKDTVLFSDSFEELWEGLKDPKRSAPVSVLQPAGGCCGPNWDPRPNMVSRGSLNESIITSVSPQSFQALGSVNIGFDAPVEKSAGLCKFDSHGCAVE